MPVSFFFRQTDKPQFINASIRSRQNHLARARDRKGGLLGGDEEGVALAEGEGGLSVREGSLALGDGEGGEAGGGGGHGAGLSKAQAAHLEVAALRKQDVFPVGDGGQGGGLLQVGYRQRLLHVEGAEVAVLVPTVVVVDPVGGVGVLLDLTDENTGTDRMDGTCLNEEDIARLNICLVQYVCQGLNFKGHSNPIVYFGAGRYSPVRLQYSLSGLYSVPIKGQR